MAGVNYQTALEADQAKEMKKFLSSLLWASDKAKEAGVKPNIELFMYVWIGLPISEEEKRKRLRQKQVDYRKRKREAGGSYAKTNQ